MSGVLRDGRESGLYQYISKLNIEGSTATCAYVSSHPVALHWASISMLPFLKLAKMISVLVSREKTAHFLSSPGGINLQQQRRRRGEGAGEIDRSRSGRQVGALGEGRAARVRGVEARLAEGRAETTARARRESLKHSRRCIRPPRPWGAARRRGEAGGGARGG